MVYLDTSVLIKLYFREQYSLEIAAWIKRNNQPIPLTRFHELEFFNAVKLKQFRDEIVEEEAEQTLSRFQAHEKKGVYYRPLLEWPTVFHRAIQLSKEHTYQIGARSLDILHVASALAMNAGKFFTLDRRQSELARSAGLKVEALPFSP